ncbi:MAG: hypothetical protein NC907_00290 [Candidatus Omnitrophica bacterium]|nr:hypothetical protein [Candidatus Omnitrophota bacterium]
MDKRYNILAGAAEIDITPAVGTLLAGSLKPRASIGIEDPLYVKAIVIESNGKRIAYVIFDLVALDRTVAEKGIKMATEKTGISAESIVWAASHTHTGPYTCGLFIDESNLNNQWLETIPEKMAQCIIEADRKKTPVKFSQMRSFHYGLGHNRRIEFKDGRAINTWLLANAPEQIQSTGSAGPIDPEIGIFCFEKPDGKILAVMFHFTLHTNTNFGLKFSADYPGIVAARLRERFGPDVITLFLPGACADINTTGPRHREVGNELGARIIESIEKRKPYAGTLEIGAIKAEIVVPRRNFMIDQKEKIKNSGWDLESQKFFYQEIEALKKEGKIEDSTVMQAWRIGQIGFVSFPGELFVEWGLKVKKESPFPFTYPVELGGDYLGYLVTQKAYQQGGYESLIARSAKTSVEGVMLMFDKAIELLNTLYNKRSSQ